MELENIINLALNSSVSIAVIVYFMFRDYKFINQLNSNIQHMIDVLTLTNKNVEKIKKGGE